MPFIRLPFARATAAAMLALAFAGCGHSANGETAPAAAAESAPPAAGACKLLTKGELTAVFAGTKSGVVDTSRQQYGISACTWQTEQGTFVAQYWKSDEGSTAESEARGLLLGIVDPLKPGAANNVRFESITGVGEQAIAAIETQDAARGIISDFATLVAQRGDHILVLIAPQLSRSDRSKALASLQSLGKAAVQRL